MSSPETQSEKHYPCGQCGAKLDFLPGSHSLKCPYCGFENTIARSEATVDELDYNTTTENGRQVTRTRQVRHTRWTPASGTVSNHFDDILIIASRSLPKEYADRLQPRDLENLIPYADAYLSGFRAESYQVSLPQGFEEAKQVMANAIHASICRDIGGDEQQVHSVDTAYANVTFKHILLPVWLSAFRFRDKIYRFLINARTGEVQGERPYSISKITAAIVVLIAVIAMIVYLTTRAS